MRKLSYRYVVRARLRLETPLHIGGAMADVRSDMPLAEDGQGQCYIPGTSLAGALRAALPRQHRPRESRPTARDTYPWGPEPHGRGHVNDPSDQASYVVIEDAIPILPEGAVPEIRDHVGIARDTGAAAPGIKYDRAVLPCGTVLPLSLTLEVPPDFEDDARRELIALLQALKAGAVRFGAARSRGLGRVYLDGEPEIRKQNLASAEGIKQLLKARMTGTDTLAGEVALKDWDDKKLPAGPQPIDIQIHWQPVGPVMVKSGEDGIAVDMLPLVSADGTRLSMVLPGSAIKGALRAHAERILRTIYRKEAPKIDRGSFLEQIGQPELELARWLFGAPGERRKPEAPAENEQRVCAPNEKKPPGLGLAALWVDDVYLSKPFDRADWNAVAEALEFERKDGAPGIASLAQKLRQQSAIAFDPAMHVAVDRWTGGAAEHQLYSVLEPHAAGEAWEPIRLTLRLDRLREDNQFAALGLLLLTLRDVADGLVPIGFGGNRGLGAIMIDRVAYRGLDALDLGLEADRAYDDDKGKLQAFPEKLRDAIGTAWRKQFEPIDEETARVG